ncbi:MAG: tyrosine-protein phosphatase [Prevotella sp.]|jgi:protein-tyrosine phosphatase|nr:tyrosine-protein phosphatase [Prevotella sp.]
MKKLYAITILAAILCSCNKGKELKVGYSGEDISKDAEITYDKESKNTFFKITTDGKWSVYSGNSVEAIDFSHPILSGEKEGIYKLNVCDSTRSYYQLITDKGQAILAENHLPMAGGFNFRDLGGIKTKDGRHVKWGKIIRSDELKKLTEADLKYLSSIPIVSIVDFRSKNEIEHAPDLLPASVNNNIQLSIDPGNLLTLQSLTEATKDQLDTIMINMNILFVSDSLFIERYKEFFKLLQDEKQTPLLFHCTAGKDRTGMGAALILFALGVDEDTIIKDYLASNIYLKDKYAKEIEMHPMLESVLTVKQKYLQTGIDRIKKEYGSVDKYITTVLNVDTIKFRELYLY